MDFKKTNGTGDIKKVVNEEVEEKCKFKFLIVKANKIFSLPKGFIDLVQKFSVGKIKKTFIMSCFHCEAFDELFPNIKWQARNIFIVEKRIDFRKMNEKNSVGDFRTVERRRKLFQTKISLHSTNVSLKEV